jgi:hypothetical protein
VLLHRQALPLPFPLVSVALRGIGRFSLESGVA